MCMCRKSVFSERTDSPTNYVFLSSQHLPFPHHAACCGCMFASAALSCSLAPPSTGRANSVGCGLVCGCLYATPGCFSLHFCVFFLFFLARSSKQQQQPPLQTPLFPWQRGWGGDRLSFSHVLCLLFLDVMQHVIQGHGVGSDRSSGSSRPCWGGDMARLYGYDA